MRVSNIHHRYILGILSGLLVIVATTIWTEKNDFTVYLTNIATAVSLVLGLVAIFYAFISNNNLSKSIGNISNISHSITKVESKFSNFLESSVELSNNSKSSVNHIKIASNKIEKNLQTLIEILSKINEKTEFLQQTVNTIPDDLKRLRLDIEDSRIKNTDKISPQTSPESVINHYSFLNKSSLTGNYLLFAAYLAHKHKKPLSLGKLQEIFASSKDYFRGFLIASTSAGLVDYEHEDENDAENYKITSITGIIDDQYENQILEDAKNLHEDSIGYEVTQEQLKKLKNYFSNQEAP